MQGQREQFYHLGPCSKKRDQLSRPYENHDSYTTSRDTIVCRPTFALASLSEIDWFTAFHSRSEPDLISRIHCQGIRCKGLATVIRPPLRPR
jgi:hypothetical protein